MTEGNEDLQKRLGLLIQPSIYIISEQNCTVPVRVLNHGSVSKTIGKGSKIACCLDSFVELPNEPTGNLSTLGDVNTPQDPIKILSAQMTHLPEQQFKEATMILESYCDVFTIGNAKIGCTNITEFDINTDSMSPISAPLRRVPIHQQEIVKELLEHYRQLGLIEPYDSPYHAATILVKKKNVAESQHVTDQYRLCVDYRFLNNSLSNSGWPAPSVSQCLDAAHGSTFISAIDFNSGYHQIPCTDHAKTAIAFSPGYGFGQWTWNLMPQGIKPASSNFQRSMDKLFYGLSDCVLPPFYDDITIKGKTFEDHKTNVCCVLQWVRDSGFTLNALKCKFFQTRLPYLGYILNNGTILSDLSKVQAIKDFLQPTNVKSLRTFLGMAQFCDRFIRNFSVILAPLHELTRHHNTFKWNSSCQEAFEKVKQLLVEHPVLHPPSSDSIFILETDASDVGVGHCLKALDPDGPVTDFQTFAQSFPDTEYIVGYGSRKFNDTERGWNIVEKEVSATMDAVRKHRHHLLGKKFLL